MGWGYTNYVRIIEKKDSKLVKQFLESLRKLLTGEEELEILSENSFCVYTHKRNFSVLVEYLTEESEYSKNTVNPNFRKLKFEYDEYCSDCSTPFWNFNVLEWDEESERWGVTTTRMYCEMCYKPYGMKLLFEGDLISEEKWHEKMEEKLK